MSESHLKRCPFCNGIAYESKDYTANKKVLAPIIRCMGCGASTSVYEDSFQASRAWNQRA